MPWPTHLKRSQDLQLARGTIRYRALGSGVPIVFVHSLFVNGNLWRHMTPPLLRLAEQAEDAGFDAVWAGDSLLARPRFEPLTLLAAVAARTHRVRLGTAVPLPALRHPLLLAHAVATVDRLTQGRLILGVGTGYPYPPTQKELAAVGVPYHERVGRLLETVRLCRAFWSESDHGATRTLTGKYWTFADVELLPKPYQPGGPPIWSGTQLGVEASLRRVGRLFDGWLPTSPSADAYRKDWCLIQDAAQDAGRPRSVVTPALYVTVSLHPDAAQAQRRIRTFMETYYGASYETLTTFIGCYAGSVDGCLAWLSAFIEAGARHVVLRFADTDQPAQVERVAKDLLPALRSLRPGALRQ